MNKKMKLVINGLEVEGGLEELRSLLVDKKPTSDVVKVKRSYYKKKTGVAMLGKYVGPELAIIAEQKLYDLVNSLGARKVRKATGISYRGLVGRFGINKGKNMRKGMYDAIMNVQV